MNHAVRRRSNDHDAQPKGTQILLVLKTPIHAQQDIETPLSTPKQLTVRRARPACGLHGANLVSRQLGGESTRQILVKQNAHRPKRNSEPDRARRVPVALRPTGTDRGTGRVSLPLPSSRTVPEPAPACRGKPAYPQRFPSRCGRPRAHQSCDQHTLSIQPVAPHRSREAYPRATSAMSSESCPHSTCGRRRRCRTRKFGAGAQTSRRAAEKPAGNSKDLKAGAAGGDGLRTRGFPVSGEHDGRGRDIAGLAHLVRLAAADVDQDAVSALSVGHVRPPQRRPGRTRCRDRGC